MRTAIVRFVVLIVILVSSATALAKAPSACDYGLPRTAHSALLLRHIASGDGKGSDSDLATIGSVCAADWRSCDAADYRTGSFQGGAIAVSGEEDLVRSAFKAAFGLGIPHPAWSGDLESGYLTGTAHLGWEVFRVYVYGDGSYAAVEHPVQRPAGNFRTISIGIDYGNTNIAEIYDTLWVASQAKVNEAHAAFAQSMGYANPIVSFEFTNFLITSDTIAIPSSQEQVFSYLLSIGFEEDDYDLVNVLALDAQNPSGGFTNYGGRFIYMGWYYESTDFGIIDEDKSDNIARATYAHEAGHVWGWEHGWGGDYDLWLPLAAPVLFGWVDTDGDQVPEILDSTPYGMEVIYLPFILRGY